MILPYSSEWMFVEYEGVIRETEHGHPSSPEEPLAVVGEAVEDTAEEGSSLAEGGDVVIVVNQETVLQLRELPSPVVCTVPKCSILLERFSSGF